MIHPYTFLLSLALLVGLALPPATAQITYDGTITESDWLLLDDNAGAPGPGFGAGHEVNALYAQIDESTGVLNLGLAGSVLNGNRILVFIDSRTGGVSGGGFDRTNAPEGVDDFNGSTTFDAGFEPDYCLVIGTNFGETDFFFDLFTLVASGSGTGSSVFLGSTAAADLGANQASSDLTRGFEAGLTFNATGSGVDIQLDGSSVSLFAAYTSDGGFLSNQFMSPASSGQGNFGSGAVTFGSEPPNPLTVASVTEASSGGEGWRMLSAPGSGLTVADLAAVNLLRGIAAADTD
ncbi:MAG: hypothetical protein AAFX41_16975, partial [Bacteroidota bacterium]